MSIFCSSSKRCFTMFRPQDIEIISDTQTRNVVHLQSLSAPAACAPPCWRTTARRPRWLLTENLATKAWMRSLQWWWRPRLATGFMSPGTSSEHRWEIAQSSFIVWSYSEGLVVDWRSCFSPRCLQESVFLSPNMNCVRPEEITVNLRKISGSLGISISVSSSAKCSCLR